MRIRPAMNFVGNFVALFYQPGHLGHWPPREGRISPVPNQNSKFKISSTSRPPFTSNPGGFSCPSRLASSRAYKSWSWIHRCAQVTPESCGYRSGINSPNRIRQEILSGRRSGDDVCWHSTDLQRVSWATFCLAGFSLYRRFTSTERIKEGFSMRTSSNTRPRVDGGWRVLFAFGRPRPRATQGGRSA